MPTTPVKTVKSGYQLMKKHPFILFVTALLMSAPVLALDTGAVIGGAVGGGLGAAVGSEIGGKEGAIIGGALGAAAGTAIAIDDDKPSASPARTVYLDSDPTPENVYHYRPVRKGHPHKHHCPPGRRKKGRC